MEHPRLDLRQLARRGELSTTLSFPELRTQEQADALTVLAILLSDDLCGVLIAMIRATVDGACAPLRELIGQVAELLTDADPVYDRNRHIVGYRLAIATGIARRLVSTANGETTRTE
jgi:hypothetical protein